MSKSKGTILIVDDVPTNLNVLMEFLESSGYRVLVAVDGESAIEQALYVQPDVILLDVMMPILDGFETCRRLKSIDALKDIPVLFMTALSETTDKVHGFALGAADFLTKPLHQEEVVARVNAHLMLHRQRQEIERLREQDHLHYVNLTNMKDQVLSTVSHDLKNPLTTIMTAVAVLRYYVPVDDAKVAKKLDNIENAAHHMRDLIVNLLDLARLETGVGLEKQAASVHQLLTTCVEHTRTTAEEKGVQLQLRLPAHDISIHCVAVQIVQALENLMHNAIKYTPGGGYVRLSAEAVDNSVCIRVKDTGIGIPADALPNVFKRFFRVNTTEHMAQSGTGLGLSIVREIVTQHHGDTYVTSKRGRGSIFSILLPSG